MLLCKSEITLKPETAIMATFFKFVIGLAFCSQFCLSSTCNYVNITGGNFELNTYKDSYVIKAADSMGPKLCIKDCLMYTECDGINYSPGNKLCELLKEEPSDGTKSENSYFYSSKSGWSMDYNQCWPNPCGTDEKCIVAMHGYWICIPMEKNACTNYNECAPYGVCRNAVNGVRCACNEGYSGDKCQITPCSSTPCQNGATCELNGSSYTCKCINGYSGINCQVKACDSGPCVSGTCSMNAAKPNGYQCTCNVGHSGTNCEITPCDNNPCRYGGTCSVTSSSSTGYTCKCVSGYSGLTCQTTPCSSSPCKNGGTCRLSGSSFTCSCRAGYTGSTCNETV